MMEKYFLKTTLICCIAIALAGLHSCTTDRSDEFEDYDIDTDGDGIFDSQEV